MSFTKVSRSIFQWRRFFAQFSGCEFLDPYLEDNDEGQNDWIEGTEVNGPTTTRAPGFPYLASLVYRQVGRDWDYVRIANMLVLAIGLACLVVSVRCYFGVLAACLTSLTLALDFGVVASPGKFLTEATGTGVFAIACAALLWVWNSPNEQNVRPFWKWCVLGMLFGICMLFRNPFVGWMLQLIVICVLFSIVLLAAGRPAGRFFVASLLFLLISCLVCLPWWARNCNVSNAFLPFGSAGTIGFVGGFSDEALVNDGNWWAPVVIESQTQSMFDHYVEDLSLAEQEYLMGADSVESGLAWIKENPGKLLPLSFKKALNHLGLIGQAHPLIPLANSLLLLGALSGCVLSWRKFGFWVAVITFLSLATTILTWSHHGRFAIPIRPVWHAATGIGIVLFWSWVLGMRRQKFDNDINLVP